MRSTTALAIARAGSALQLALDLVEADPTLQPSWREQLLAMRPVAVRLGDVPLPPPELEEEPGPARRATCSSCGTVRIITALSGPTCPSCGRNAEETA